MRLFEKHIDAIKHFVNTGNQTEAFGKYLSSAQDRESVAPSASRFFAKPEVKKMVDALTEARDRAILKANEEFYNKIYAEKIATELELDIFHTAVVRGEAKVEELFAVKEKVLTQKFTPGGGLTEYIQERVVFKSVKRAPSIKEKQVSASELYKRKGSYKPTKVKVDQDDQEAAMRSKGVGSGAEVIERCIILSTGERLPLLK